MDRLIYTALSGATQMLARQAVVAHNLANADTSGFKAELSMFRAVPVNGTGLATRAVTAETTPGADFTPGPVEHTGRNLDVAVDGPGWLAVQATDGREAYTRNGNLQMDATGLLRSAGHPVLADNGQPVVLPLNARISVAADGTISALAAGQPPDTLSQVARIKCVADGPGGMRRDGDGLFRPLPGATREATLPMAKDVRLAPESLEASNVSATETMVGMIADARQFEMHMKMLSSADENERGANRLLDVT